VPPADGGNGYCALRRNCNINGTLCSEGEVCAQAAGQEGDECYPAVCPDR
jgi:hypothetical protein